MADFSVGFAVGIGAGLSIGTASGIGIGQSTTTEKIERQLHRAVIDNEISILDKNGEPLAVDALLKFLNQKYKKV